MSVDKPNASNCCLRSFTDFSVSLYSEALLSKPVNDELELVVDVPLKLGTLSNNESMPGILLASWV